MLPNRKLWDRSFRRCRLDRHYRHQRHRFLILKALGYETDIKVLSVPVTYHLAEEQGHRRLPRQLDADAWKPTSSPIATTSRSKSLGVNLEGAKYTLAPMPKGAALGIKDFKDIAKFTRMSSTARFTASSRATTATA
jgi:ABC-type proline/glycine betaine transport system substrate-binding protein